MISMLVTLAGIDLGHRLLPNPNSVLRDRGKLFALALAFRGGMGMFRTPGTAVPEMAVPEMAVPVPLRVSIAVAASTSLTAAETWRCRRRRGQ